MHRARRPLLHLLYTARRRAIFRHHERIEASIFARPCSCTAALASDLAESTSRASSTAATDIPKPAADHRDLAIAQGLFTTSPYSPGSPLLLPNGADMFIKLTNLLRSLYPQFGFREVITPTMYKRSLWEQSGHWENYADDMFEVRGRGASGNRHDSEIGQDEQFGLKPMNCPGHCLLFSSEKRSYRDLPIRFADFSALHRNEISGALSGLTRVRRFHQDDGHIFCRPSQIEAEIKKTMDFIQLVYGTIFNFGPYRLVLSTRPYDNYIGSLEEWDSAEKQLKAALDHSGREWSLNEGDGAFYGPKIDIILKDSDGKEHQTATIQLDFQLPQRFGLQYIAPGSNLESGGATAENSQDMSIATPVMIHRAVLGSVERFLALLIEHYDGCYPFWISPRPAIILSVSQTEKELDYIHKVASALNQSQVQPINSELSEKLGLPIAKDAVHIHTDIDTSARSLGKKIREAKQKGYNFILVVGPNDVEGECVSLEMWHQQRPDVSQKILPTEFNWSKSSRHVNAKLSLDGLTEYFTRLRMHYL